MGRIMRCLNGWRSFSAEGTKRPLQEEAGASCGGLLSTAGSPWVTSKADPRVELPAPDRRLMQSNWAKQLASPVRVEILLE